MQSKVYIKYCRPFESEDDEPAIDEVWSDGKRPKKKLADQVTLYVYDVKPDKELINGRLWDGID